MSPSEQPANTNTQPDPHTEIPLRKTILYSFGSGAGLFLYNTFNAFLQFFYTDVVGLPAQWVGRGWFAFSFWNAINDPIAGWLSDNKKSARGRRTWFIRVLTVPVSLAFLLVWLPPVTIDEHGATAVFIYFILAISLYDMLQSMITLNVDALFPEMFQQANTRLNGAVTVTLISSTIGGIAVAAAPTIYESDLGWMGLALIWSGVALVFYLASLGGIVENPHYAEAEHTPILERLRIAFSNRTFWIIIGLNFVLRFILAVLVTAMPFYARYALNIRGGQTSLMVSAFVIAYTGAVLIWQPVFRRFGTRRALLISLTIFSFVTVPAAYAPNLEAAIAVLVLIGLGLGGALIIGATITFAEMLDEDFARTGVRREGIYRGILGFVYRLPPALSGLLLGELLHLTGYDATLDLAAQPAAVGQMVRYFVGFLPVLATISGIFLAYFYPMHGDHLREVEEKVRQLNEQFEQ
jgi:GPH family glycoside/pentoside/hexuronide:cation symporter